MAYIYACSDCKKLNVFLVKCEYRKKPTMDSLQCRKFQPIDKLSRGTSREIGGSYYVRVKSDDTEREQENTQSKVPT